MHADLRYWISLVEAQLDSDAKWKAHLAQWQKKLDAAKELAAIGKPMRFTDTRYPHLSYLISPELRADAKPGTWRVTTFTNGEPYGHMEFDTAYDAFKEATTHSWEAVARK